MAKIDAGAMRALVTAIFVKAGCDNDEASRIAHHLTHANLTGHDSHGVIRVPRYCDWLRQGRLVAGRHVETILDGGSFLILDGGHGFGQTVGPEAASIGIERAKRDGLSMVALRRAGHLGRIGDFAQMAIDADLMSIHFVNVHNSLLVAPFGGRERRFSTNPIAIGVPTPDGAPFLLDFATSMVAEGKVLVAHQGGKPVPSNALVDQHGAQTNDSSVLYGDDPAAGYPDPRNGPGALRTFGEHKGSGLALACELLAGALTGSGINAGQEGTIHNGMLSFYIDPDRLDTDNRIAGDVAQFIERIRTSEAGQDGDHVLIPGDKERAVMDERNRDGLPVPDQTLAAIVTCARDLGVEESAITSWTGPDA